MKLNYIIIGVIALGCIASCQRDKKVSTSDDRDVILVRVNESSQTRSAEEASPQELLFSVPAILDNGDSVVVNAFISDMDEFELETRGAAITNANIGTRLGSFPTSVYKDGATYVDETGLSMANVTVRYQTSGDWELVDGLYHWPSDGSDITFCSYAPTGVTGLTNINWHNGASLSFNYSLPAPAGADASGNYSDAMNQPDILFAMDPQNENDRVKASDGKRYADIQFNHALVAVRFTRGNIDDCTIETIALKGFYGAGSATATLTEGATVHGNATTYGDKLNFTWTTSGTTKDYVQSFNKELKSTDASQDPTQHTVTGASLDASSDGSRTFMMIPQVLATGATLEIKVKERIHPLTVVLTNTTDGSGNPIDNKLKDWSGYAGKIITISVNSVKQGELVDVEITDQVSGKVKTNAKVTNTKYGDPVYVRVAIIANWVKADGTIIYPYEVDNIAGDSNFEGVNTDWVYDSDGFYYYKHKMAPNTSVTLFTKFTSPAPPSTIPDIDHLQMTLLVQGFDASKKAEMGSTYGWPISHYVD
ncbi:MAG: fimbrillin family protein [Bacteroidales bacterium]|nr:fimbrillin family protein [Bacteroidales bacterium]